MGELRSDVLKTKVEFYKVKARIEKYRVILIRSFYSGGFLLLLILWWILFPPEQSSWRLISNIGFTILLFNLWVSYWMICRIKSNQKFIGELRIKLRQMLWEKICECEQPCDCSVIMEREIVEESNSWSDGIMAEVENGTELS